MLLKFIQHINDKRIIIKLLFQIYRKIWPICRDIYLGNAEFNINIKIFHYFQNV